MLSFFLTVGTGLNYKFTFILKNLSFWNLFSCGECSILVCKEYRWGPVIIYREGGLVQIRGGSPFFMQKFKGGIQENMQMYKPIKC